MYSTNKSANIKREKSNIHLYFWDMEECAVFFVRETIVISNIGTIYT